jgi:CRISPR-associated exonuclease Cas4
VIQDDVVPISAIEHHEYCPRQCALIHVDGVWAENEHTERGRRGHRRVDSGEHRQERGRLVLRSIPLWSEILGLAGRADALEVHPNGAIVPIEFKVGTQHGRSADLQLCAQALCLEEMTGQQIRVGYIWYSATRRRIRVEIDQALRSATVEVIETIRQTAQQPALPLAVDDERCTQCQLIGHCLPELSGHPARVRKYLDREVFGCAS